MSNRGRQSIQCSNTWRGTLCLGVNIYNSMMYDCVPHSDEPRWKGLFRCRLKDRRERCCVSRLQRSWWVNCDWWIHPVWKAVKRRVIFFIWTQLLAMMFSLENWWCDSVNLTSFSLLALITHPVTFAGHGVSDAPDVISLVMSQEFLLANDFLITQHVN